MKNIIPWTWDPNQHFEANFSYTQTTKRKDNYYYEKLSNFSASPKTTGNIQNQVPIRYLDRGRESEMWLLRAGSGVHPAIENRWKEIFYSMK